MRTPTWCRHRAGELGPAVTELVEVLLTEPVLHRLRAAQGVLRLAERYPLARLDAACARAIEVGDPSYRDVEQDRTRRARGTGVCHADLFYLSVAVMCRR